MGAAKKSKSSSPLGMRLRSVFSWLFGPGRTALVLVLLAGLFGGGAWLAWLKLKDRILADYRIGAAQVEITPQPPWIPTSNIRAEVFGNPTLDGPLSIMDDDLAERIGNAFARHPWVEKVLQVTKQYGSVKVDLVYRRPVCMVAVPDGYQPVDAYGVLLPMVDFSHVEVTNYPVLVRAENEKRGPTMPPGSRWEDPNVIGGAEIAAALGDVWEPMRFYYIEPSAADPTVADESGGNGQTTPGSFAGRLPEPFFTLVTHNKTRILWGHAPGANALGEPSTAEKVAWLKGRLADNDTLDGPQGAPQVWDIHKSPPVVRP